MGLVLVRIDDRLIHGQVVENWMKFLKINHVVVVNDFVAGDRMQKTLFSMAVPEQAKISILSIAQAKEAILNGQFEGDRAMLLLVSPQDVLDLINKGVRIKEVNVGGMHYSPDKKQILKAISVSKQDIQAFQELDKLGVHLEARMVPDDEKIDIMEIIRRETTQS
ncbi:PTS transporter subunit IIB [bacterium]|nr:PTS transporter subunit IIB [bacterium]NIN92409.1 PTS transporter subunit IIB [bacterium]NIO18523.1 PTS transporter subunit IIB [bacterium]NIO73519.1 PTS transporter subunit IIB [bacterium]